MLNDITTTMLDKYFETIKKLDENNIEYWEARELMPCLGYQIWEKAEDVIIRAARACLNSGQTIENHFRQSVKMVQIGSRTMREIKDWKLDRYACNKNFLGNFIKSE